MKYAICIAIAVVGLAYGLIYNTFEWMDRYWHDDVPRAD